ncbi:MAG TPA: TonB-dependent receptor [Terriglobia bacterium]|nr:TonB-dependent receptor [Terriglobia bacterium]
MATGILLLVAPTFMLAQAYFGGIGGTVTDSSNAAIPGAVITVTNTQTGVKYHVTSNQTGYYSADQLIPGDYTVTAENKGFQTQVVGPIKIDVNSTVTANITMKVGSVTQRVQVRAVAPLINTTSGTVGTVVNNQTVQEMPLNGRNFTQLLSLVPGSVSTGNIFMAAGGSNYSVSGMQSMQSDFTLDGVFNNEEFFGQYALQPVIDSIQEFQVRTNITSAEYGRAAGANIAVATKSGTNQFHGDVWEFLRNNDLDANSWFSNYYGVPRPVYRHNQFGFTAGGPIYIPHVYNGKDKAFWFADYEGTRFAEAQTQLGTIPTAAMLNGDFSAPGSAIIYDPSTTTQVGTGPNGPIYSRQAFAGNIIPSGMINSATAAYAKIFYPSVSAGGANNLVGASPSTLDGNQWNVRGDYTFSDNLRFFARVTKQTVNQLSPTALPAVSTNLNNTFWNSAASLTWLLNPTTVLDVKSGFNRASIFDLSSNPAPGADAFLAANPIQGVAAEQGLFPPMSIAGFTSPGQNGSPFLDNVWQQIVDLSMVRGKQTLKMGFEDIHMNGFTDNYGIEGNFSYDNLPTAGFDSSGATIAGSGNPVASFLLALPSSGLRNVGQKAVYMHQNTLAGYFQDDIRVTRKLTVNLGLRYEYDGWPFDKYNHLGNYYFDTHTYGWAGINPITGAGPNSPRALMNSDWNNIAPRIGLAYSITPKTVIRAGFGKFYEGNNYWMTQGTRGQWPYAVAEGFSSTNTIFPDSPLATYFGNYFTPAVGTPPNDQHVVARDNVIPSTLAWNIGVQRQLTEDLMLEVTYVGNAAKNTPNFVNGNDPLPGPGVVGSPQHPRPEQQFAPDLGPVSLMPTLSSSNYHGLQVKLDKRFSHGLQALFTYTYAHALATPGAEGFNYNGAAQNSNCRYCDYGNSYFDLPHIFTATVIYDLPFGKGMQFGSHVNPILNAVFGNWETSGLFRANSGSPFTIGIPFDVANTGPRSLVMRPNYAGGSQTATPAPGNAIVGFLNPSAFAIPAQYTYGNLGVNTVRGPGTYNLDAGLYKNFPIHEGKQSVQFRSEFFNLPNTHSFGCINGTLTTPGFGQAGCTQQAGRIIQFALKIYW